MILAWRFPQGCQVEGAPAYSTRARVRGGGRVATDLQRQRCSTMRSSTRNHRRAQLRVESLEGKTLLSAGSVMPGVAPHVTAAPIVARATAAFSGTLTGSYGNVNVPGFSHILNYTTSGTLSGVGSTRLRGTCCTGGRSAGPFDWPTPPAQQRGQDDCQRLQVNHAGELHLRSGPHQRQRHWFQRRERRLMITQAPTFSVPFYVSGQATMTFT